MSTVTFDVVNWKSSTVAVINMTGGGTAWVQGTTAPSIVSGGVGASIVSLVIHSPTTATITLNTGTTNGVIQTITLRFTTGGFVETNTIGVADLFIAWVGDSITSGDFGNGTSPTVVGTNVLSAIAGSDLHDLAISSNPQGESGTTAEGWANPGVFTVPLARLLAVSASRPMIISIALGTNDAVGNDSGGVSRTPAQFQADMATIIAYFKANISPTPIFVLQYPIGSGPGQTVRNAVNPTYQPSIDALVDNKTVFAGHKGIWGFYFNNPTELTDQVHPTSDGYYHLGGIWASGIERAINYQPPKFVSSQVNPSRGF